MPSFANYYETRSQPLPQCCKLLADPLSMYLLLAQGVERPTHTLTNTIEVTDEGFICIKRTSVSFDESSVCESTPRQLEHYIDATRPGLSVHDAQLFKMLVRDRWYKGDFERMKRMMAQRDISDLIGFACNVLWERGYENHYTLGQQLSIRITTKLIQSGLDFKHQSARETRDSERATANRGWQDAVLEKFFCSINSISDVIKRHRCFKKYILLELPVLETHNALVKKSLAQHFSVIHSHNALSNVCALEIDAEKNSLQYLRKLAHLIEERVVNVLFVTDVEHYMKTGHYMFYLYNSLKLYYYCLTNKFVFEKRDYEIIFLLNLIVSLEWHNGGHLNSFMLEKSLIYNPLELSTRRQNSIKRAGAQTRVLLNDSEIKINFIKGKRIKTGTHYGHRLVEMDG
ncbi:p47 [Lambdina fiscellaria nucleopolyhedrovirus]|uniref:p47 n=1 Tax=Lambdina fiscellaria nucleopolyhedrovirus TaxID=1642929 RepID=A0A0E3Z644_9ABAC|nr:p47 [Lambdina fiscellaria nucleopolyhedrovirus]AKC91728.1 p47 [Lambdina fiscellaria nucleopolyhedrovirus]